MEGGTNYTCMALSQGWPSTSLSALSVYTGHLQVRAKARILTFRGSLPLYRLTRMFGHIPLVYSSLQSGLIRGIDEGSGRPYTENVLPHV